MIENALKLAFFRIFLFVTGKARQTPSKAMSGGVLNLAFESTGSC
jgi:hypothetical protein